VAVANALLGMVNIDSLVLLQLSETMSVAWNSNHVAWSVGHDAVTIQQQDSEHNTDRPLSSTTFTLPRKWDQPLKTEGM
jgi:hypothetical protein